LEKDSGDFVASCELAESAHKVRWVLKLVIVGAQVQTTLRADGVKNGVLARGHGKKNIIATKSSWPKF